MKLPLLFSCLLCFSFNFMFSQVGINTTTPKAALDINSTDEGVLIPRVQLTSTTQADPVSRPSGGIPENSTLVYNTETVSGESGVSPGFYYWQDDHWVALNGNNSKNWALQGNSGTDSSTDFLGTTDNTSLNFKTNNTNRLRIPNKNQLYAMSNGSQSLPFYSWNSDANSGMWRDSADIIALGSNNTESITLDNADSNNKKTVINNDQADLDFQVKSTTSANSLYINGENGRLGVGTNDPQSEIHLAGNNSTIRIEGLNTTNNNNNASTDPTPVYVNNNGELELQPPLVQTYMALNLVDFIATTSITSNDGSGKTATLYTTDFTLSQESLVYFSYQFSVSITRADGSALTDGGSRLFRAGLLIDGSSVHLGYDTGTYTNNPETNSTNSVYASGYYYLSGSGYLQLDAGTHTLVLDARGFGASYDFKMNFGETNQDRLQVVVQR